MKTITIEVHGGVVHVMQRSVFARIVACLKLVGNAKRTECQRRGLNPQGDFSPPD